MSDPWLAQENAAIAFSFIGFVLVNVPLYWHLRAWNIGCLLYMFWVGSACLIQFINGIVWKDNVINWAPVWCDITTRWMLASSIGFSASSLVIMRRLYHIANITTIHVTHGDKRRMVLEDTAVGVGIPVLQVLLYYFIQGHRFDLFEGIGCWPAIPNTILSWFLYDLWPVFIGTMSAVYCTLTIRAFLRRRKQIGELMSANSDLNFNRYFRLMALASIELLFIVPLAIYTMVVNASTPVYIWRGLSDLHYDFSAVNQYPAVVWRASPLAARSLEFSEWTYIGSALLFFGFFGFSDEARKNYRTVYDVVVKRLGIRSDRWGRLPGSWQSRSKGSERPIRVELPTLAPLPKRGTIYSTSGKFSISISLSDVGPDGNVVDKAGIAKTPCTHSTSSVYSTDTETCVSFKDMEAAQAEKKRDSLQPALPLDDPDFVLDIRRLTAHRAPPDVPSSVRHSVDIV